MIDNKYLILCKQPIIQIDDWLAIYADIRKSKSATTFGYGIKVDTNAYPALEAIRADLPFKDHFFFLISNMRRREFPIHVDGVPGACNAASVNWPLQNCFEDSPTTWYSCDNIIYKDLDNSFFLENTQDAKEIHSEAMLSNHKLPYLFRSDVLHKGYCNLQTSGFRIIVKWELNFNDWQTTCSEFYNRNYI